MNSYCGARCKATGNAVVSQLSRNHYINVFTIGVSPIEALQIGAIELDDVFLSVIGEPSRDSHRAFRPDVDWNPLLESVRSFRRRQHDNDFTSAVAKVEYVRRA